MNSGTFLKAEASFSPNTGVFHGGRCSEGTLPLPVTQSSDILLAAWATDRPPPTKEGP